MEGPPAWRGDPGLFGSGLAKCTLGPFPLAVLSVSFPIGQRSAATLESLQETRDARRRVEPQEQVEVTLDDSDLDDTRTFLLGDGAEKPPKKTRDPIVNQQFPTARGPRHVYVDAVAHARI